MATDNRVVTRRRGTATAVTCGSPEGSSSSRSRFVSVGLPAVVTSVAAVLRFYRLGYPERVYFDEQYYANDASQYLAQGVEEGFAVHPPVGKWLIAGGIEVFGFDSFGWRSAAAVAGTLLVLVTYLAATRLFRNRGVAGLAGLLVAVDGLAFTMSRIAMLDIFLALFVITGFWLLLIDRDRLWALVTAVPPLTGETALVRDVGHRYRWLAGLVFGLALATKWSAALPIAAAGLFVLVSELAWRQRVTGRRWTRSWEIVASGCATLLLVPVAVYVVSYAGWFANYESTRLGIAQCSNGACAEVGTGDIMAEWWKEQGAIARFHEGLTAEHPYRSSPTTWPFLTRPVAYYFEGCDDPANPPEGGCVTEQGNVEEILGVGNPMIWWSALAAYAVLAFRAVVRHDWRAATVLLFVLLQYVPWVAQSGVESRPAFLFYMLPVIPFMALALAYVAGIAMSRPGALRVVPAAIAVGAVAGFLFLYPVLVGAEISRPVWDLRLIMDSWI